MGLWHPWRKGRRILVQAFQQLKIQYPALQLSLVGTQRPAVDVLRDFPVALHSSIRVIPSITADDLIEIYQAHDIFLLPSLFEGMPLTVLEAMASALPVVTTQHYGMNDLITHYENGLLIPRRDVNALVESVSHLLESPQTRQKMGQAAYETVSRCYTWQQIGDFYEEKLSQLVNASATLWRRDDTLLSTPDAPPERALVNNNRHDVSKPWRFKRWRLFIFCVLSLVALGWMLLPPSVQSAGVSKALSVTIQGLRAPLTVPEQRQPADVVIAISAGLLNDCNAHPNLFLREAYGASLVRMGYSRSQKLIISGIYSRPPTSQTSCHLLMARRLNLDPAQLIMDNTARTTLDNARHCRDILRRHHWKNAVLVTSQSHMFRAAHTFQKQNIPVHPMAVMDWPPIQAEVSSEDQDTLIQNKLSLLKRFLYEYGALLKYKWYGYL